MRFNTRRAAFIKSALAISFVLPLAIVLLNLQSFQEKPFVILILFIPFSFFLWIYVDTHYTVKGSVFYYRSAFTKGEIAIDKIQKITKGKTSWSGIRPATAMNGLTIQFNKYDEVYISPEDDRLLVSTLLEINSNILVVE